MDPTRPPETPGKGACFWRVLTIAVRSGSDVLASVRHIVSLCDPLVPGRVSRRSRGRWRFCLVARDTSTTFLTVDNVPYMHLYLTSSLRYVTIDRVTNGFISTWIVHIHINSSTHTYETVFVRYNSLVQSLLIYVTVSREPYETPYQGPRGTYGFRFVWVEEVNRDTLGVEKRIVK